MVGITEDENCSDEAEDDVDGVHCEGRRSGSKGELQGEE
jgi:hypothetical protein